MDEQPFGCHGALRHDAAVTMFGAARVLRERRLGRWTAPWPGLLVEAVRAAAWLTLASAAVQLANHPEAVLTGPTAARLHRLMTLEPTPVHLQVPYCHPLRTRPGLRIHNGPFDADDVVTICGLPVLRKERVLADLLCTARPPDALALLDEALAQVREEAEQEALRADIARRIRERADPRGTVRAMPLVDLATGRAASPQESRLLWQVVDSGFPIPEVNHPIRNIDGQVIYLTDLAWVEHRIAIEYYGYAAHVGRSAEDEARVTDLRRRGWIVIEVWLDDVTGAGRYQAELDDAFRRRGVDTTHRQQGVLSGRRHREKASPRRQG